GTLETGKLADLVVVDSATYDLVAVMRRGEWITGGDRFSPITTARPEPHRGDGPEGIRERSGDRYGDRYCAKLAQGSID
ncbi:hypothetical protein, partial [Kitasatospora purpeofusca]